MSIGRSLRYAILSRDSFTCRYCGAQAPHVYLEVDHVVPKSHGGSNDPGNLVTACFDCNRGKKARDASDDLAGSDWIKSLRDENDYLFDNNEKLRLIARIADVLVTELSSMRGDLEADIWDWAANEVMR